MSSEKTVTYEEIAGKVDSLHIRNNLDGVYCMKPWNNLYTNGIIHPVQHYSSSDDGSYEIFGADFILISYHKSSGDATEFRNPKIELYLSHVPNDSTWATISAVLVVLQSGKKTKNSEEDKS